MPFRGLLEAVMNGDRRSLAKALTLIEQGDLGQQHLDSLQPSLAEWFPSIGVTGAPGVGKSCLIGCLIEHWAEQGVKVAVLAVDPTSPLSGGALLGDRLRMEIADIQDNVFVRSVATRRSSSSVPSAIRNMLTLLKSAGFERCVVETVGTGQSEVRVMSVVERLLLVESPGRGDSVQAEKAGVIELADLIVVNKSDLPDAEKTADEISNALNIASQQPTEVLLASALNGTGINVILEKLENLPLSKSSTRARSREMLHEGWMQTMLNHPLYEQILAELEQGSIDVKQAISKLEESIE